jgi:hypothetical protein
VLYSFDLTIPAATPQSAPVQLVARLQRGVITRVRLKIPPGVAAVALTQVYRANFQVWPSNPGGALTGDGEVLEWREQYVVDDVPVDFILRGWSPSARFAHTLTWQFEMQTLDQARAAGETPTLLRRVADVLLGRS